MNDQVVFYAKRSSEEKFYALTVQQAALMLKTSNLGLELRASEGLSVYAVFDQGREILRITEFWRINVGDDCGCRLDLSDDYRKPLKEAILEALENPEKYRKGQPAPLTFKESPHRVKEVLAILADHEVTC